MPLLAQRGGGHAAGGHGGFGGHASVGSHFGGMRSGSGMTSRGFAGSHQSSSRQSLPRQAFSRQSFAHQPSFVGRGTNSRFRGSRVRSFGRRNCFGCSRFGYGYPWGYAGFYDPYWWWDSGSSYDEDRARELDMANQMNQQNLEEQQMRQQGDQDIYASPSSPHQSQSAAAPSEIVPPTVLVFRDQRKQEVQNYAIVSETLWSFSPQRTQKIPLSDLDLAATTKANDERGVNFRLPNSPEGQ